MFKITEVISGTLLQCSMNYIHFFQQMLQKLFTSFYQMKSCIYFHTFNKIQAKQTTLLHVFKQLSKVWKLQIL